MRATHFIIGGLLAALACLLAFDLEPAGSVRGARAAGGERAQAATPLTPLPSRPIAVVAGTEERAHAQLFGVRRTGASVVTATLRIAYDGNEYFGWTPDLSGQEGTIGTAEGLRLVDETNRREHPPLEGPDGECLCTTGIESIEKGESIGISAKFPAPPANVDRVSLHVPDFQSFDGVPLT